jgi:hypothetical protein
MAYVVILNKNKKEETKMKKIIALLTAFALMGAVTACKKDETKSTGNDKADKQTTATENNAKTVKELEESAKEVYQYAQQLVQEYEEKGIDVSGYIYSTSTSDYAKDLDKKLKSSVDQNGEKYDFSGGWAVAIANQPSDSTDIGTAIGAVVAGGGTFGSYPADKNGTVAKCSDIQSAVKASAEIYAERENEKLENFIK